MTGHDNDVAMKLLVMLARRSRDANRTVRRYSKDPHDERYLFRARTVAIEAHNAFQAAKEVYNEAFDAWLVGIIKDAKPKAPPDR